MSTPFFTVLMPVHRWQIHLPLALQSIIDQDFQNYEFVIVVNGSDDTLQQRIEEWAKDHERIRIISTPLPGLVFALNFGAHFAEGKYLVRMDSDDVSEIYRLSELYKYIQGNPMVDVIGSNYIMINGQGETIKRSKLPLMNKEIRAKLPFNCVLAHPTVAIRRELLLSMGGYMYGHVSEDYDLWLRMLRRVPQVVFHNIEQPLFRYRQHPDQATGSSRIGLFVAHDISLRFREFLLTGNPVFIAGIARSCVQFFVRKVKALQGIRK